MVLEHLVNSNLSACLPATPASTILLPVELDERVVFSAVGLVQYNSAYMRG